MSARSPQKGDNGFVLIAVLWIIAALAGLASIYALYVRTAVQGTRIFEDQSRASLATSSAVELTALRLLALPEGSRPHAGAFTFRLDEAQIAVRFESEAGRVDLNAAPLDLLKSAFLLAEPDPENAVRFAQMVIRWRSAIPESQSNSAPAPARKFRSPLELYELNGIPRPVVAGVLPFVTAYTGSAKLDIETTAEQLLSVIPSLTPERAAEVTAELRSAQPDEKRLSSLLASAQTYVGFLPARVIRVHVQNRFSDGYQSSAEIVLLLFEQGKEPFAILSWKETSL